MNESDSVYPDTMLICDACGEEIVFGDVACALVRGRSGVGPKSGQPMVVDDASVEYPVANLHPGCVAEFSLKTDESQNLSDETIGELQEALIGEALCAACGVNLD